VVERQRFEADDAAFERDGLDAVGGHRLILAADIPAVPPRRAGR
jgi:hypothetical protein